MIDFKNVCYSYGRDITALDDISFHIDEGESVALIGANGSGKSTLMKMLNGLIFPDRGAYFFDGQEITSNRLRDENFAKVFHKRVGFVFQNSEVQLFCPNVYDEIAFGPRQLGMSGDEVEKRVSDVLGLLHIESLRLRQPYHLSGGEKKRVAIASTAVLNPDVYVFDEPMNGLDPRTKRFLREFMIGLNSAGKTVICSTQDFEYVNGVFKRAIVFSGTHNIIRDGSYEEIMGDSSFLYDNNII